MVLLRNLSQMRASRRHSMCAPGRARLHSPPDFRKTRMSSTDARTALQLRSLVKQSGELEVSLAEVPVPEPGAGRGAGAARGGADQSVRPRPAVLGRRHDEGGRLGHAERPVVTAPIPEAAMKSHGAAGRRLDAGRQRRRRRGRRRRQLARGAGAARQDRRRARRRDVRAVPGAPGGAVPAAAGRARRRPTAPRASSTR